MKNMCLIRPPTIETNISLSDGFSRFYFFMFSFAKDSFHTDLQAQTTEAPPPHFIALRIITGFGGIIRSSLFGSVFKSDSSISFPCLCCFSGLLY